MVNIWFHFRPCLARASEPVSDRKFVTKENKPSEHSTRNARVYGRRDVAVGYSAIHEQGKSQELHEAFKNS